MDCMFQFPWFRHGEYHDLSLLRGRVDYFSDMMKPLKQSMKRLEPAKQSMKGMQMWARDLPSQMGLEFMKICAELNHHISSGALRKKFLDMASKGKKWVDNMGIHHVRHNLLLLLDACLGIPGIQEMIVRYVVGHEFEFIPLKESRKRKKGV